MALHARLMMSFKKHDAYYLADTLLHSSKKLAYQNPISYHFKQQPKVPLITNETPRAVLPNVQDLFFPSCLEETIRRRS